MRGLMRWTSIALLATAIVIGCEYFEPDVGGPTLERCVNEDSDPDTDVSFTEDLLGVVMNTECSPCHDPNADGNLGFELTGLDLTDFAGVMAGGANSGVSNVVPGAPCDSLLVQKIGAGPPFGSRMPFDGPPFLSDSGMQMIHDWIAEGARNN